MENDTVNITRAQYVADLTVGCERWRGRKDEHIRCLDHVTVHCYPC